MKSLRYVMSAALLGLLVASGTVVGTEAAGTPARKVVFDIDAQPLGDALRRFGEQTGLQVVLYSDVGRGLKAPRISGDLTPQVALDRLLANTGLKYEYLNAQTVAISDGRQEDTSSQLAPVEIRLNLAQAETVDKAVEPATEDKKAEVELTVTGSRIRTMVGEQTLQPVFVMDREAIERTGAADLGEVFRHIPQITSSSDGTGLEAFSGANGASPIPNEYVLGANLRGFSGTQTLILVDGKRVNKNNQVSVNDRFDIIGLPLGSVERIEVLLDGASAVYGADALAGVINIITRKDYNGTEARISYDNMFDTDASKQDYQLSHGISRENWNLNFSVSHQRTTALAARDLETTRTNDRRAFGGNDGRSASTRVVPGWIRTVDGSNLPGMSTSRAPIPDNSAGVDLTVADYAAALAAVNALPRVWNPTATSDATAWGERWDSATVNEEPTLRQNSFRINGEYSFNDAVSVYASANYLKAENQGYSGSPYSTQDLFFNFNTDPPVILFANGLTLPAGYPGNPFGVPIVMHKIFLDNLSRLEIERSNMEGMVGIRGDLPRGWRYDASARLLKSRSQPNYKTSALLQANLQSLINSATPPVLLYDSTRRSMPSVGDLFYQANRPSIETWEKPQSRTFSADAEGPIWRLPSGDVRLALSLESREDIHDTNADLLPPTNGYSFGVGAEVRVPIVSPEMKVRGLHRVDLGVAGRHDRYSEYPEATNPSYRLMIQPVSWLSLRVTRSEGTRVPSLFISRSIPRFPFEYDDLDDVPETWVDPLRNNEPIQVPFTEYQSGNPNLEMEESVSYNYSVTVDVPAVPGLSLTASHWSTDNFNRFSEALGLFDFDQAVTLFPELFIREPSTGPLPGRIVGRNYGFINLSASEHAGWDAMARYNVDTAQGMFDASVNLSRTTENNLRVAGPGGDVEPGQSGVRNQAVRLNGSLFWSRGPVSVGTNVTYSGGRYQSQSSATLIPGSTRWDLQMGYNFARADAVPGGWVGTLTRGTRVNLTVFNILDEYPPLISGQYRFGIIERKQQRYNLNITKEF